MFNYNIIRNAALQTQQEREWRDVPRVRDLKFSNCWVRGFLLRHRFRRRAITREDKKFPSIDEIHAAQKEWAKLYREGGYAHNQVLNMDETGFGFQIGPTHMYVPPTQERAHDAGAANVKARVSALLTCDAEGRPTPAMLIIKHKQSSAAAPDQTKHTVLDLLQNKPGWGEANDWEMGVWKAELELPNGKGEMVKQWHLVKYLRHRHAGHIVTSQHKAWSDTVRMCMWVDLVLKPLKEARGKLLLYMDNCSVHHAAEVKKRTDLYGIRVQFLLPNTTALLQPLDLCVNGPLKRYIRMWAADNIARYFFSYKEKWRKGEKVGKFRPPKMSLPEAMIRLFDLLQNEFNAPEFTTNVSRTFAKCGIIPSSKPNEALTFEPFDATRLTGFCEKLDAAWNYLDLTGEDEGAAGGGAEGGMEDELIDLEERVLHGEGDDSDDEEGPE